MRMTVRRDDSRSLCDLIDCGAGVDALR